MRTGSVIGKIIVPATWHLLLKEGLRLRNAVYKLLLEGKTDDPMLKAPFLKKLITTSTVEPFFVFVFVLFFVSKEPKTDLHLNFHAGVLVSEQESHFSKKVDVSFFRANHCSSGMTGTPGVPDVLIRYEKASQCHTNDKEMTIRSGWGKKKNSKVARSSVLKSGWVRKGKRFGT